MEKRYVFGDLDLFWNIKILSRFLTFYSQNTHPLPPCGSHGIVGQCHLRAASWQHNVAEIVPWEVYKYATRHWSLWLSISELSRFHSSITSSYSIADQITIEDLSSYLPTANHERRGNTRSNRASPGCRSRHRPAEHAGARMHTRYSTAIQSDRNQESTGIDHFCLTHCTASSAAVSSPLHRTHVPRQSLLCPSLKVVETSENGGGKCD